MTAVRVLALFALMNMLHAMHAYAWTNTTLAQGSMDLDAEYTSLALNSNGWQCIAYYDDADDDLHYMYWDGDAWQDETVDAAGTVGRYASLALDAASQPHIAYYDSEIGRFKYARRDGTNWQVLVLANIGAASFAGPSSIVIDSNQYVHICFEEANVRERGGSCFSRLYWTRYSVYNGTNWSDEIPAWHGRLRPKALRLDTNGMPHICYYDCRDEAFRYVHKSENGWSNLVVSSVQYAGAYGASLALGSSGDVHFAYARGGSYDDYAYATYDGTTLSNSIIEAATYLGPIDIEVDRDNKPHFVYSNGGMKYVYKDGSTWHYDPLTNRSSHVSFLLDSASLPHITHTDYWFGNGQKNMYLSRKAPDSPPLSVRHDLGRQYIEWSAQPGVYHQLQVSSNLTDWLTVGAPESISTPTNLYMSHAQSIEDFLFVRLLLFTRPTH